MSDVYHALRRTVVGLRTANLAQATRNARREVHELASVMAQVDALERRLATAAPTGTRGGGVERHREPAA